jgi:tripartite-type tricarboxylate transporter receptor subunit TctC
MPGGIAAMCAEALLWFIFDFMNGVVWPNRCCCRSSTIRLGSAASAGHPRNVAAEQIAHADQNRRISMHGFATFRLAAFVGFAAAAIGSGGASADGFYAGKQMIVIAGTETGGGYDLYARNLARYLPRHLPGTPTVIVQNMPGAGGIRAANFLYSIAPKDGLTIGQIHNGNPFAPLYGHAQAQFDPTKFNWLGSPAKEISVFLLWHTVPVNTIEEAKGRELILGAAGSATGGAFYSRLLSSVFGLKIKNVAGYKGLAESLLAMERGENEGYASTFWSTLQSTRADWIRDKKIKILLRYSGAPTSGLEGVPLAEDLTTNEEDRLVMQIAAAPFTLGRPIAAPPGIPADRLTILKQAVYQTIRDPEYRADCSRQQLECDDPSTGEELAAVIEKTYAAPAAVRKRLAEIYQSDK